MDGSAYCRNEISRLTRLAHQATTEKVRAALLRQAREYEATALEIELVAQQEEADSLVS